MERNRGFTLIELMIVVAIIGILAAVAIPKFADLARKSKDGATKGNLGAIRSALAIYYSDNEGVFPQGSAGQGAAFLDSALTGGVVKYLAVLPDAYTLSYHASTSSVDALSNNDPYAAFPADHGGWAYDGNKLDSNWGSVMVECYHTDSKGLVWSTY